jgi:hypothetical protein
MYSYLVLLKIPDTNFVMVNAHVTYVHFKEIKHSHKIHYTSHKFAPKEI